MNTIKTTIAVIAATVSFNAFAIDLKFNNASEYLEWCTSSGKDSEEACKKYSYYKQLVKLDDVTERARIAKAEYEAEKNTKAAKAAKAAKIKAAKPGVKVGMTASEVIDATSWGKPQRINTTTTSSYVREQWVYGGGNYLYFKNGVLTTIQN